MSGIAQIQASAAANAAARETPRLGLFNRRAKLAAWQNVKNQEFIDRQNEYNSPKNQMARYAEAGLNPALIYSQGNPGNQASAQTAAEYEPVNPLDIFLKIAGFMMSTAMQNSQRQAIEAGTRKTIEQTATERIKQNVLDANPYLNPSFVDSMLRKAQSDADLSQANTRLLLSQQTRLNENGDFVIQSNLAHKFEAELKLLEKRFELSGKDLSIKAEILQSKQFENAILEVEKKFMTEFKLTPQNWMQFLQLMLMRFAK